MDKIILRYFQIIFLWVLTLTLTACVFTGTITQLDQASIKTNPFITINHPLANTFISSSSQNSFTVNGTCYDDTQNVVISGAVTGSTTCLNGTWSVNLDFSSVSDGSVTVNATQTTSPGSISASVNLVKDTV
ncbi:MAG TPA: hypothetical protein VN132_06070, partial [Bdellovibrio sp.]|nr:hypothetical protein [Bdellovibrio sp.]